ncbi:probable LRR receptor-like serine/threonine-protein kinase at N-terminal half [Coccomyxa sp. Obi]|nr:probable LRR receptor-like serine/threonine-protein kinase at N-terminal half [Coccomyxa sp. Obi]
MTGHQINQSRLFIQNVSMAINVRSIFTPLAILAVLLAQPVCPANTRTLLQTQGTDAQEEALLLLKASLDPTATALPSWDPSTSPCQWQGITCNPAGQVTNISLPGQDLTGQLPLDATIWGALPEVQSLDLKGNALNGYVPPQMSGLAGAQSLDLSNNQLQGPLPPLANMSALESVTFANNQLTGSIPASWADNLRLTSVNLSNNTLTGSLPADWSRLSSLQNLNASANLLTGALPASWRGVGANGTVTSGLVNLNSLVLGQNPGLCRVQHYGTALGMPVTSNFSYPPYYVDPCNPAHAPALAPALAPGPSAYFGAPAPGPLPAAAVLPAPAPAPVSVPFPAPAPAPATALAFPPAPAPSTVSAFSLPAPAPAPAALAVFAAPAPAPATALAFPPAPTPGESTVSAFSLPAPAPAPAALAVSAAPAPAPAAVALAAAPSPGAEVSAVPAMAPMSAPAPAPVAEPALAPLAAPAPAPETAPAPAPGPTAPPPPATAANVTLQLSGVTAEQFASEKAQFDQIIAQTAGVPVSWVNTTVVPSGSGGSTGGRSAAGRRLQQQATQGITVTSRVASDNPEQVQTAINNAVSSGALGQALSGIGLTLVPPTSPVASPMSPASVPASPAGIAVPSPAQQTASGNVVPVPPPSGGGGGGGRPAWQIAVIVIAVLVGVFIAVNVVYWSWFLVRRHKRKQMGEKYLKSETVNPAFEAEEAAEAGRGGDPKSGGGGGALARGDDFERLRVEPAAAGGKAGAAGTPKAGAKGLSAKRGAGAAAAAAAGGGALGALMGRKKESDKDEPLLAQREGSFRSAHSADSFSSARSRAQSNVGSFTSAQAGPSDGGRPSDKDEMFSDAAARDDSFASAASFGQASAVSAKSFQSAKSGARDWSRAPSMDDRPAQHRSRTPSPLRSVTNPLLGAGETYHTPLGVPPRDDEDSPPRTPPTRYV